MIYERVLLLGLTRALDYDAIKTSLLHQNQGIGLCVSPSILFVYETTNILQPKIICQSTAEPVWCQCCISPRYGPPMLPSQISKIVINQWEMVTVILWCVVLATKQSKPNQLSLRPIDPQPQDDVVLQLGRIRYTVEENVLQKVHIQSIWMAYLIRQDDKGPTFTFLNCRCIPCTYVVTYMSLNSSC